MSGLSQIFFTTIPFIAFIANVFLFFTLLSAKKEGPVRSFMGLLVSFILWTGGSYFMRLQLVPGVVFWWKVSLTGIFLVPFMYYLLVAAYMGQRGRFLKSLWGSITLLMIIGNFMNVFMTTPEIIMSNARISSSYDLKWPAIIAVAFAVMIFASTLNTINKAVHDDDGVLSSMTPLFIGVVIMMLGIALNMIPALTSVPTDTMACAINACFIYYAFYKKRFYAMSQITSKGSVFIVSIVITAFLTYQFFDELYALVEKLGEGHLQNPLIFVVVAAVTTGILIFLLFTHLNDGLFVRDQLRRDYHVKDFSKAVSSTLRMDEILMLLSNMIRDEIPIRHMYLCMRTDDGRYLSAKNLQNLDNSLCFSADHPLLEYIGKKAGGFLYEDFRHSACGKGMFEEEKKELENLGTEYVLPFIDDNKVIGLAILPGKENRKAYTYSEIDYLESVSSVASIALKNAMLYEELENEAQHDVLTGLLNRRALNKRLQKCMDARPSQLTLILFNMDDFSLYNELYGNDEGDYLLQNFAKMLLTVFGSRSISARYSGKEFAVLLPEVDAISAKEQAERVRDLLAEFINSGAEKTRKFLTFSAGICSYPSLAGSANQLLSYANLTVFQIKQHGKNGIEIYSGKRRTSDENHEKTSELSSTIYALTAAIDAKDHYTFNHSRCVSEYAAQLAEHAGLGADIVEVIRQAGFLHDIGKIGIPDAILSKTGHLTTEEFAIMRQHVERSIEMIRHLPSLDYVIPAVVGHHEKYGGGGYPRGIAGEAIPVTARCLSIADSFDAMVSKRSYKNKMPVDVALEEIEKHLGTQFDPKLGKLFVELVRSGEIKVISY